MPGWPSARPSTSASTHCAWLSEPVIFPVVRGTRTWHDALMRSFLVCALVFVGGCATADKNGGGHNPDASKHDSPQQQIDSPQQQIDAPQSGGADAALAITL